MKMMMMIAPSITETYKTEINFDILKVQ